MRYLLSQPWVPIMLFLPTCLSSRWCLLGTVVSLMGSGVSGPLGQLSGLPSYRKTIYGPNVIGIPVKSYLQLLVDEVKDPGVAHSSLPSRGQCPSQPERPG